MIKFNTIKNKEVLTQSSFVFVIVEKKSKKVNLYICI